MIEEDDRGDRTWTCTVCRSRTSVGHLRCRICRTAVSGDHEVPALEEDTFVPASLRRVLPRLVALLLVGGLVAQAFPSTYAWTSAVAVSGWTSHDRVSRLARLQEGIAELHVLSDELSDATRAGRPVPGDWTDRLTRTRTRWLHHGDADRFPQLRDVAVDLTAIGQDLASLQVRGAAGAPSDLIEPALNDLRSRLDRAKEDLSDVR